MIVMLGQGQYSWIGHEMYEICEHPMDYLILNHI